MAPQMCFTHINTRMLSLSTLRKQTQEVFTIILYLTGGWWLPFASLVWLGADFCGHPIIIWVLNIGVNPRGEGGHDPHPREDIICTPKLLLLRKFHVVDIRFSALTSLASFSPFLCEIPIYVQVLARQRNSLQH